MAKGVIAKIREDHQNQIKAGAKILSAGKKWVKGVLHPEAQARAAQKRVGRIGLQGNHK